MAAKKKSAAPAWVWAALAAAALAAAGSAPVVSRIASCCVSK